MGRQTNGWEDRKGTSNVWIKLKKELTFSILHIYLCDIYMTPLSNTTEIIIHNKYNFYIPLYESEIIQFQYEGPVLVMGDMNGRELRENQTI